MYSIRVGLLYSILIIRNPQNSIGKYSGPYIMLCMDAGLAGALSAGRLCMTGGAIGGLNP